MTRPGIAAAPDGFPFPMVDRVLELEPGARAVGTKLVSANEPWFVGHFPAAPVLPGVLICEALAQLGALLVPEPAAHRLVGVEKARFRRPVLPGDALHLDVRCVEAGPTLRLHGTATVGDAVVAEVDLAAAPPAGPRIHPTAQVARGAELAEDVEVGPYAVIGPHVRIGAGTRIGPHAVVEGRTTLGERCRVFQFASVGSVPQDLKYRGEPSTLDVGSDTTIREFVSINPGTAGGGMATRLGSGCLVMVNAHVGHDARIGDNVVVAPGVALGGHVVVEDYAIIGGLVGVHQFVRIGESALCAAGAMVTMDVPPYCVAAGDRARLRGVNTVGLRRRGFARETIVALRRGYRLLFHGGRLRGEAMAETERRLGHVAEVQRLLAFMRASARGVCR